MQASPASSRRKALSNSSSGSSWVISGRRSTTPLSSSQRVRYQVSKIFRPLTARTSRFLKISVSATSIATGRSGIPNRITRPPFRAMRNASATARARAGHLEDDVEAEPLVVLEEPARLVLHLADVDDVARAHASRRARAGAGPGRPPARPPRPTPWRSRSRTARSGHSRAPQPSAPRGPARWSHGRRCRTAPAGWRSPAAASRGRSARRRTREPRRTARTHRLGRRRGCAPARTCAGVPCGTGSRRRR